MAKRIRLTPQQAAVKAELVIESPPASGTKEIIPRHPGLVPDDLSSGRKVSAFLKRLMPEIGGEAAAAALVPWVCDALPANNSRVASVWHCGCSWFSIGLRCFLVAALGSRCRG